MKTSIPNLFIIGAPKNGTTALAYNLSLHENIFIPKVKEPTFFDAHIFYDYEEDFPIKNLKEYLSFYDYDEARKAKYRLDGSVFNMYSEEAINNILKLSPNAKFIIILRDPISASISMHKQRLKYAGGGLREISEDFVDCWNMIEERKKGNQFPKDCRNKFLFRYDLLYSYEMYLPFIINNIKKENLFIAFYEEYKEVPELFFRELFDFLEVKNIEISNSIINESFILKKSMVLLIIQKIVNILSPFLQKVGLSKNRKILKFKDFIYSFYRVKSSKIDNTSKVKEFFNKTYDYLDELKKVYSIYNKRNVKEE